MGGGHSHDIKNKAVSMFVCELRSIKMRDVFFHHLFEKDNAGRTRNDSKHYFSEGCRRGRPPIPRLTHLLLPSLSSLHANIHGELLKASLQS